VWVELVSKSSPMTEYHSTGTPGYYNGEGVVQDGQAFLQGHYPDSGVPFCRMLAHWREQGEFAGLIVT
jgi:hypothetical protein